MSNIDFIVAKVRGMRGKLYEHDRLSRLCDVPTIEDLATSIAPQSPVGDILDLERQLTAQHVAALRVLLPLLDGWQADLFLWMLRRYQVENLKVILRCWATKAGEATLSAHTVPLPDELELPAAAMMRSPSIEALINQVPVTALRDGALLGLGDFEESGRLFFIESGLDKTYFTHLQKAAQEAKGLAREPVLSLVPLESDIYNTMLVLRGLFNYSILFNKLRNFLAPPGPHVPLLAIEELRSAADLEAAARLLPPSLLGRQPQPPAVEEIEAALWLNLYRLANRLYYSCVLDFGAVVAFFYIKRVELSNLIRVAESIRYGEHAEDIRGRLIGATSPAAARNR